METEQTPTSVDVLIARLETNPEEFFDPLQLHSMNAESIFGSKKWRRLVDDLALSNGPSRFFTKDERARFREALRKKMREFLDTEILECIMLGKNMGWKQAEKELEILTAQQASYNRIQAMQQAHNPYTQGTLGGLQNAGMTIGHGIISNAAQATLYKSQAQLDAEARALNKLSQLGQLEQAKTKKPWWK